PVPHHNTGARLGVRCLVESSQDQGRWAVHLPFFIAWSSAMHVLVTRRLTLRTPTWLDAEDIAAGLANWNVARMLAPVPFPYHLEDADEWLAHVAKTPDDLVYTIHRERLIGVVSLHGGGPTPSLGYWLA